LPIPLSILPYIIITIAFYIHFEIEQESIKEYGFRDDQYYLNQDTNSYHAQLSGVIMLSLLIVLVCMYKSKINKEEIHVDECKIKKSVSTMSLEDRFE